MGGYGRAGYMRGMEASCGSSSWRRSSGGVGRRVGERILAVLLRLLSRRFPLFPLVRLRRCVHSFLGALVQLRVQLTMPVAVLACRPVNDAFVRLDQREVVFRDEADLARQLVVDDSTCLDL